MQMGTSSTPDPLERQRCAWLLLAALGLWLALALPFLLGRVYAFDDAGAFHLPLRWYYAQQLAAGQPFDWFPGMFGGFFLTGEGQVGAYHPWHLLLYRLLPADRAWGWELLLNYPLAMAGMTLMLRRHLAARDAALWGGLVYAFGSFNLLHFMHVNAVGVMAHLPWLLWGSDLACRESGRWRLLGLAVVGLATGSQILLGYPQYVWISLVAELWYLAFLASQPVGRAANLARWSGAKTIGALLGGVQLLTTWEALGESTRQTVDPAWTMQGSLAPANLLQWVAPYLWQSRVVGENTHELGAYLGAVPLVLAAWLLVSRPPQAARRRLLGATLGLGALALLMSLGAYGPLGGWQSWLPVVNRFRFPCRFLVLVNWSAAVVSAIAVAELFRRSQEPTRPGGGPLLAWASLLTVSLCLPLMSSRLLPNEPLASWPATLAGPALLAAACAVVWAARRGRGWAPAALVLLTAFDLGCYGLSYAVYPGALSPSEYFASVRPPLAGGSGRVLADSPLPGRSVSPTANRLTMLGWQRVEGYAGLRPRQTLDLSRPEALRLASVHWVARSARVPATGDQPLVRAPATASLPGGAASEADWTAVPGPLPRFRLVSRVVVSSGDPLQALGDQVASAAVVGQPVELDEAARGTVQVRLDRPQRIELEVETTGRQLCLVADRHHPGWQARVDGEPTLALRVNGDFRGCLVPAGRHRVVWTFAPASLRWGRRLSALGVVLGAVALVYGWRRERASERKENST